MHQDNGLNFAFHWKRIFMIVLADEIKQSMIVIQNNLLIRFALFYWHAGIIWLNRITIHPETENRHVYKNTESI